MFSLGLRFTNPEGFCFSLLSHRDSLRISVLQVANTKRETVFKWLKDDVLYETETPPPDLEKGICELLIPKVPGSHRNKTALTVTCELSNAFPLMHRFPMLSEENV